MKDNRGITLTSLIIYVIGMVIVVSLIATLTTFFYKNVNVDNISKDTTQYTKFSNLFLDEINKKDNDIVECKTTEDHGQKISYIIFSDGNQYTYKAENKSVYKNKIKICKDVEECEFSYIYIDSTYQIKINFKTSSVNMTGDNAMVYSMKNGQ